MYVGKTVHSLDKRVSNHENAALCTKTNTHFHKAIRKYGLESFIFETLENVDEKDIDSREKYWISYLDTYGNNGYNETKGGEGGDTSSSLGYINGMKNRRSYEGEGNPMFGKVGEDNPNFGKKRTEAQKSNIKRSLKKAWDNNKERKKEFSEAILGEKNPMFGKVPSNARKVEFEGVIYNSLAEAYRETGRSPKYIKKNGKMI